MAPVVASSTLFNKDDCHMTSRTGRNCNWSACQASERYYSYSPNDYCIRDLNRVYRKVNLYKLNNRVNYLGWEEVPDKPNREAYDRDIYMPIRDVDSTKTTREETIWDSLGNNWGDGRWYSAAEFECATDNYEGVHDD